MFVILKRANTNTDSTHNTCCIDFGITRTFCDTIAFLLFSQSRVQLREHICVIAITM